jgi:DNA-binding CsgD family transcriptional regulator
MATSALTPRQSEIIELLDRGLTNKEIAVQLGISEAGVKAHVSRLLLRYGAANRVALLRAIADERGGDDDARTVERDLRAIGRSMRSMQGRGLDIDDEFATLRALGVGSPDGREEKGRSLSVRGATPRIARVVSELRAALGALELGFDLAERLPPEAIQGPLLDVVRGRVKLALAATDALNMELFTVSGPKSANGRHRSRRSAR